MPEGHSPSRVRRLPRRLSRKATAKLALVAVVALAAPVDIILFSVSSKAAPSPAAATVDPSQTGAPTGDTAMVVARSAAGGNTDGSDLANRIAADPALGRSLLALRSAAKASQSGHSSRSAASIVIGGSVKDIPGVAIAAYVRAAGGANLANPSCHIPWTLIAGIGRVESNHGQFGGSTPDAAGVVHPAILGPVLNGGPDMAAIVDTDGGRYDGDTRWDRAVGPMQFIPSTWATGGRDGNGDGISDPENLFDAARATGDYLCASGGDLRKAAPSERAVLSYNHSWDYVLVVLGYAGSYAGQDISAISADVASHLTDRASIALFASGLFELEGEFHLSRR